MRALVTRPIEDAQITAQALRANGIEPIIFPLISINYHPQAAVEMTACLGKQSNGLVVATSMQAVRALAAASNERHYALWVVGTHTAERASALGFTHVRYAGENVSALIHTLLQERTPQVGTIYYASSQHVAYPLKESLTYHGFQVEQYRVYDAIAAQQMDASILTLLQDEHPLLALFFSERTASIFCNLLAPCKQEPWLRTITPIALSSKIADTLAFHFPSETIRIASNPTHAAMLQMAEMCSETCF